MATCTSEEGKSSGARLSSDETIKERRAESEKPAPTNKFMKTWHKAALIIIVIVGVLISVKSCVDRKNPDITMAYIGDGFLDREAFEENKDIVLNSVASDINGDGEFNADMMLTGRTPEESLQMPWVQGLPAFTSLRVSIL